MPRYRIVRNRIQLFDDRFDHYLDESLLFFKRIESIAGSPPPITFLDSQELTDWRNDRWKKFSDALENCRHKVRAINYSVSLIDSEMKNPPIPHGRTLPMQLDETEFFDDVVLFEFESFFLQISSSLDIFVQLLSLFYPKIVGTLKPNDTYKIGFDGKDGRAGKRTIQRFMREDTQLAEYMQSQVDAWIQDVYDLRNLVAHQSRVRNLQMFLVDKKGLHMPKLSGDGVDLLAYCREVYGNMKSFLFTVEENFLLLRAEKFYEME